jgi:hypothetical protein
MVERGSSASGNVRGASTRTDVPLSDVSLPDVGLAATALDGETPPEAKKRSGAGAPEATPPPDGEPDPWIGRVLANVYRVEQKIGEGGMGAVYLARHVHLQQAGTPSRSSPTTVANKRTGGGAPQARRPSPPARSSTTTSSTS